MDPIGEERADFRISYLATIITNLAIGISGKKGAQPKTVKDFLIDWDVSKPKKGTQSIEDIKRIFGGIAEVNKKEQEKRNRNSKRIPKSLQK